jgi:hypothetical protein
MPVSPQWFSIKGEKETSTQPASHTLCNFVRAPHWQNLTRSQRARETIAMVHTGPPALGREQDGKVRNRTEETKLSHKAHTGRTNSGQYWSHTRRN